MRVALVNPPAFAALTTFAQEAVPPLGLAYVAAAAREAGHDVTVVDAVGLGLERVRPFAPMPGTVLTGLSFDDTAARVPADADVVGVSCMFSNAWPATRLLLRALRRRAPGAKIVLGGEHATACAAHVLETCDDVDACVLGEGEAAFVAWLDAHGAPVDGVVERARPRPLAKRLAPRIRDLAAIPRPAWDLFPLERYLAGRYVHGVARGRTMPILASRGCPYRCTFCSSPQMWTTKWSARPPGDVVAEMRDAVRDHAASDFAFYDLTAIVRRDWIVAFCSALEAARLDVTWQLPSGTRTEALDEEVCRLLHRAGCRNLNYAPESGSDRVLRDVKKKVVLARMLRSIEGAVRAGLEVKVNVMLGFPDETAGDVARTFRLVAQVAALGVDAVSIFPFSPYPGTALFDALVRRGRVRLDDAYFASLVYTDLGRMTSYCDAFGTEALRALVLAGNALFLAVQAGTHPRRAADLVAQLVTRAPRGKLANAIEPMRRRREALRGDVS